MFLFLTSWGSSVEHQKRMLIICQRKKRRRGKSRRRRWRYLELVFYSSRLSTTTISANRLTIACRTRMSFFFFSHILVIFWHKTFNWTDRWDLGQTYSFSIPCLRKFSQSKYRIAVVSSTVLHPTLRLCAARMITVFSMLWYKIVTQCILVVYRKMYPTSWLIFLAIYTCLKARVYAEKIQSKNIGTSGVQELNFVGGKT